MHGSIKGSVEKLSSLLDDDAVRENSPAPVEHDYEKTASALEKLARAIMSDQLNIDNGLRDLFGGDKTDEEVLLHNNLSDGYDKVVGR